MMTIVMSFVYGTRAAEVNTTHQSKRLAYNENNSWNIGEQLMDIRQWIKSLASIESRTFGRMRIIRQMLLPMAFFGGFMTAVIKAIFFTGLLNMKLLAVGVMLKLALIIGKLLYAGKIAFSGEKHGSSQAQYPAYPAVFYPIPLPSQSHSHDYHSSHYDSELHRSDENIYGAQQSNYQHVPYQQAPQPIYKQNQQPVYQQTQQYYQPQQSYQQPTYQSYDQQQSPNEHLTNGNYFDDTKASLAALSPLEMTKILSEAIAKMSAATQTPTSQQRLHHQRKRYINFRNHK
ncbi:unnamed protein product [Diamesa serratosioi]